MQSYKANSQIHVIEIVEPVLEKFRNICILVLSRKLRFLQVVHTASHQR
jgi:hypothetical protein